MCETLAAFLRARRFMPPSSSRNMRHSAPDADLRPSPSLSGRCQRRFATSTTSTRARCKTSAGVFMAPPVVMGAISSSTRRYLEYVRCVFSAHGPNLFDAFAQNIFRRKNRQRGCGRGAVENLAVPPPMVLFAARGPRCISCATSTHVASMPRSYPPTTSFPLLETKTMPSMLMTPRYMYT